MPDPIDRTEIFGVTSGDVAFPIRSASVMQPRWRDDKEIRRLENLGCTPLAQEDTDALATLGSGSSTP